MAAAQALFAHHGYDATPTSRIAEDARVPKGLVHYYFRRKDDLLAAVVDRMPEEHIDREAVVVPGDLGATLRRLVAALDSWLEASSVLSHLLWREPDTHQAVRAARDARLRWMVEQIDTAIRAVLPDRCDHDDVPAAAELLALAVSYRHSTARHRGDGDGDDTPPSDDMDRELGFIARALMR